MVLLTLAGLAAARFLGAENGVLFGLLLGLVAAQFVPLPSRTA